MRTTKYWLLGNCCILINMEIPTGESEQATTEAQQHQQREGSHVPSGVTVNFVLEGSGERLSRESGLGDTVETLREFVARSWDTPTHGITISYNGETLSSATTVEQLGADPGQSVELQVQAASLPNEGEAPVNFRPSTTTVGAYRMPEVFTVQVTSGRETKEVLVRVERPRSQKPFLGGYQHKVTGVEYHHASAQTLPKRKSDKGVRRFDRDTQTVVTRNRYQQATADAATQMNKTGRFIDSHGDRVISIGHYETADEYHQRILEKVITLQKYWRQWLARKFVEGLRRDKLRKMEWDKEEAIRRQREREARAKREFERRMNPRTKEDFELLYHALEMWRQEELSRINATTSGPERKAALCALLEQEAQLIASIGRHRLEAGKQNKEDQMKKFLDATAAPKRWTAYDGNITEMDSPFTLRAQQLRDTYNSLTLKTLSRDERLDVLLTLKCTVKEHDCQLTRELVELVDREADLLVRGMNEASLQGLRKRIASLFFQYCKTPLFNAEAAKHIKVPQDPSTLRSNIYYCRSCCQYLPSTEFELSTNSRVVGHCRLCRDLDNEARAREDFTLYRAMLRDIRKAEEKYGDGSHIIFLVQEADLRYLVESIWGSQSILSAGKDLYDLTLVRWERREQWAPWNCVLLTKEEAKGHCKLDRIQEAYGSQFSRKVHHRHVLARSYFSTIPGMQEEMQAKVVDLPLPRPKERVVMARALQDQGSTATQRGAVDTAVQVQ